MLSSALTFIEGLFQTYGAWGVFAASIIEEVIAPIPSSIVMMGAGFSLIESGAGALNGGLTLLFMVALPAAAGVTIGSCAVYGLAYWLGHAFFERWGAYIGVPASTLERARARFTRGATDEITIVALRTVPIIPSVVLSALCGILRIPLRTYLICTFIGSLLRALVLGFIGWQAQALYTEWAARLDTLEFVFIVPVGVLILGYGIFSFVKYVRSARRTRDGRNTG